MRALSERVNRIVIAGVGLIGGSVGLALKKAGFEGRIVGLGRRWSSLKSAIDVGAVDSATMDYAEALSDADLLLISTPVDVIPQIAKSAVEHAKKGCIITDVGSTKRQIVTDIEKFTPEGIYFVGAHPMAGSHKAGVSSADPSLFKNTLCIITPVESTDPSALETVSLLWRTAGAWVKTMSPEEHDFFVSAASHLPHVVACALTLVAFGVENYRGRATDFASTGFADMTRIASGSPDVWKAILLQNADMVSSMLERFSHELTDIKSALDNKDGEKIMEKLSSAKRIRDALLK